MGSIWLAFHVVSNAHLPDFFVYIESKGDIWCALSQAFHHAPRGDKPRVFEHTRGTDTMKFTVISKADGDTLNLSGDLTYSDHTSANEVKDHIMNSSAGLIRIDLSDLEFIDSMGLGMLIMMKDTAENSSVEIKFVNPNDKTLKTLKAGRLDEFLQLES